MEKMMHLAAQYLAAAGISFVAKKDDDSHTNLGFSVETGRMETHPLSPSGDVLSLDYKNFTLNWNSQNNEASFRLDGATHEKTLKWLEEVSETFLRKKYNYDFHYDLPYEIADDFIFKLLDSGKLNELVHLRILAQFTLEKVLKDHDLTSSIRVWPHHFDSGAYTSLDKDVAIGFGLAIPDTVCDEHYFYISGYKGRDALNTEDFSALSAGEWKNDSFKGAILPAAEAKELEAVLFFKEALEIIKLKNL